MNSCLYECNVMHHRLEPRQHRFVYRIFMFYLDLDEIEEIIGKLRLVSHNRFNIFNFRDSDHLEFAAGGIRESIRAYLQSQGIDLTDGRIMLLTHLRTMGHIFNPVSFFYCFDAANRPVCAVAEVGNTYREMKPFLLGSETLCGDEFAMRANKHFYVSPFIQLDTMFDFHLHVPEEKLLVRINDYQEGRELLLSSLSGERRELTDANLLKYSLRFPLITLQVISAIHWQAFLLYLKRIPYHKKLADQHLQQGVYRARNS